MRVVLLCKDEKELKLSLDAAVDMLLWLPQRYEFNRELYDNLKKRIAETQNNIVLLSDNCFNTNEFRINPSFIDTIEKHNEKIYNIVDIPCEYFSIKKDQNGETITYPDLSEWTKGHSQTIDTYYW